MAFRYWLLAGIVLVALVVIFKPVLFHRAHPNSTFFEETAIPEQANSKVVINTKAAEQNFSKTSSLAYTNQAAGESNAPTTPQFQKENAQPVQNPMVLDVGNFDKEQDAVVLVNALKAKGYRAYFREEDSSYHVLVGPVLGEEQAKQLKSALEQETKNKVIIKDYLPLKELQ